MEGASQFDDNPRRRLDHLIFQARFLESLSEGVILIDAEGKIADLNTNAAAILGGKVEDHLGKSLSVSDWGFVREDGSPLPSSQNPVTITLEHGEGLSNLMVGFDAPNMARRWVMVGTTPLSFEGRTAGLVVVFDDVTRHKRSEQHLRLLLEVSRLLTSVVDEEEFLQSVCNALVSIGGYALARLDAANHDRQYSVETLHIAGYTNQASDKEFFWSETEADGRGPSGTALRTGKTEVVNDVATQPDYEPWRDTAAKFGVSSTVAIPFGLGARTLALSIYDRYINAFDDATVRGLEEIAKEAKFGAEFVRSVRQLETALTGTITALGRMTETRDPYTAGHQIHVGALAEKIALQLGLDTKTAALIRQSGELHDVGKIAVPAEILTRPGRLTDLDFAIIKRHTTVGSDILSKASLPWPLAEVALQHHERLDGSGYPSALRGSEIILPARIIAVADVVEAMTQHRPYRPGLGLDVALAEVSKGAGTKFDGDVVAACLAVFADGYSFE